MEFRTYFGYFHTFSYKFKVKRTPTESGPQFTYYVALLHRFYAYVVCMTTKRFSIKNAEMLFSKLMLSLIAQTQIKLLTETFLISGKTNKQTHNSKGTPAFLDAR